MSRADIRASLHDDATYIRQEREREREEDDYGRRAARTDAMLWPLRPKVDDKATCNSKFKKSLMLPMFCKRKLSKTLKCHKKQNSIDERTMKISYEAYSYHGVQFHSIPEFPHVFHQTCQVFWSAFRQQKVDGRERGARNLWRSCGGCGRAAEEKATRAE